MNTYSDGKLPRDLEFNVCNLVNPIQVEREQNMLHADKIANKILLNPLKSAIFRDFVALYVYFTIASLRKKKPSI